MKVQGRRHITCAPLLQVRTFVVRGDRSVDRCTASTVAGQSLEGPLSEIHRRSHSSQKEVAKWCSTMLSQGVDDTWKTLSLEYAIDPATYVMTKGTRYVTSCDSREYS